MNFETLFSIAMLDAFIWAVRFLLPKAMKEHEALCTSQFEDGLRSARSCGRVIEV